MTPPAAARQTDAAVVAPNVPVAAANPDKSAATETHRPGEADAAEHAPADPSAEPPPAAPILAAPRLVSLTVRAAPEAPERAADSPRRIAVNQASRVETPDTSDQPRIMALERTVQADPNDLEAQFRLRLYYLAAGRDADAVAPTPGMTHDNEEVVLAMIRTLHSARSKAGRDPAEWANRQLAALDEVRTLVRQRADLRVARVALCRTVSSFGVYEEFVPAEFPAGRAAPVLVYVEAANFRTERLPGDAAQFRTRLAVRLAILDRTGQEVWTRQEDKIEDVSRNPREDFFIPIEIEIPVVLNPGEYTLKASVTDLTGQKSNENKAKFRVVAK